MNSFKTMPITVLKNWEMDSKAIGLYLVPVMEKLARNTPNLEAALLSTADGFNVCSLGVSQDRIGKLAALSSSLLSVGEATMGNLTQQTQVIIDPQSSRILDILILQAGDICLVGVQLKTAKPLNLMAAAKNTTLGVLLMSVKSAAAEITSLLPKLNSLG